MILLIDIGNTTYSIGVLKNDKISKVVKIYGSYINDEKDFFDELIKKVDLSGVTCIVWGSVAPSKSLILYKFVKKYFPKIENICANNSNVLRNMVSGNIVDEHEKIGIDLLLNGFYLKNKFKGFFLIVDFGTATTFDLFDCKAKFVGTSIVPGVDLCLEGLTKKAELLPKIKIEKTEKIIYGDTKKCMQSGIFWGYVSLVEGMIQRIKKEIKTDLSIVVTGGRANDFFDVVKDFKNMDQNLTLKGLYALYKFEKLKSKN